jgi:uncharacterized membrane protein YbhN (UPF0104 family)
MPNDDASTQSNGKRFRAFKLVFQVLVLALVLVGIWRTVVKAVADLNQAGFALAQIQFGWLLAAGVMYLLALAPCWLFWHRTLHAMGQRPSRLESFRAFYIGHLGKYVPGKALVVVLRAGLVRSPRVDTTAAAVSVFVETLTMMAVGAAVAAALLALLFRGQLSMLLLALAAVVGAGVPTVPPIFRRLVRLAGARKFNPHIDRSLAGLDFRLMSFGWAANVPGWLLMGLSQWLTLRAIPTMAPVTWEQLPVVTACVALAMVAGFVLLLPGGLGAREWVLMTLLAPVFGPGVAMVAAIAQRLLSLLAEFVLAAVLYFLKPAQSS